MRTALLRSLVAGTIAASALLLTPFAAQASASGKENDPVEPGTSADLTILVTKLTNAQATARLRSSGITWSSSGNCSDRNNPTCTSFEQVNLTTIQGRRRSSRPAAAR